ncbi:MAG: hypothetical protein ACK4MF_05530 [Hyphomicrobiaceae bacterium]
MTDNWKSDQADMELLSRVLEIYGANRSRWPAAERLALSRMLAENPAARRYVHEAELFDALLDEAPVVAASREAALATRIVAAAAGVPQSMEVGGQSAVQHVGPARAVAVDGRSARPLGISPRQPRQGWIVSAPVARSIRLAPAATLLAAALMVGIFTGFATNLFGTDVVSRASGIETAHATETIDYSGDVFDDIAYDALDEDFL